MPGNCLVGQLILVHFDLTDSFNTKLRNIPGLMSPCKRLERSLLFLFCFSLCCLRFLFVSEALHMYYPSTLYSDDRYDYMTSRPK